MAQGNDIFGYSRDPKPQAVFSSDNALLQFGTSSQNLTDAVGFLVQQWNVTYQQQVQEIFELGSSNLFWVKGRPTGAGSLARVIGPRDADVPTSQGSQRGGGGSFFPPEAFDICLGGATFELKVGTGVCSSVIPERAGNANTAAAFRQVVIQMEGVVVTAIGFTASVNDSRVLEQLTWRFSMLDVLNSADELGDNTPTQVFANNQGAFTPV
jgi:hypothetical protein